MVKKILLLLSLFTFLNQSFAVEAGYMSKFTYTKGDTLKFHLSTGYTSAWQIKIYRYEDPPALIYTSPNISGSESNLPDSSYYYGCNWPVTYSMKIPNDWQPGAYYATFRANAGTLQVQFFIRESSPGSYSKILIIPSINTWNAYNNYGGKSLYDFNSTGGRSSKVSFQRPDESYFSNSFYFRKDELHLILWLFRNNIHVEYASNYDVYNEPNLLQNYDLVIISGHNEYWSYPERIQCENYIKNGGNMMILSGNTCWWQVRYENNGNTLVCYKDRIQDPIHGIIDSLVTVNYYSPPVNNNENPFIGLSFRAAGFVNNQGQLTKAQGYGGFSVYNSHHWIFNGTNLTDGDILGWDESIAGNEVDGALFNYVNGIPRFTGADRSPQDFIVLGSTPAYQTEVPPYTTNHHGFMGIFHYPGGGTVFNSSSINWNLGLAYYDIGHNNIDLFGSDTNYYVQRITRNVIERLLVNKIPPEISSWSPFNLQNKTVMNEALQFNNRNFLLQSPQSYTFNVTAVDPFSGDLHYNWTINNISANNNTSSLTKNFNSGDVSNKINSVKVDLWNRVDTTSLTWNLFNSELVIYSTPPDFILLNTKYFHRLSTYNFYNDALTYSLTGPSWMYITTAGEIKGTAISAGSFNVTVRVSNQHGQTDSLSWLLNINSVLPVELLTFNAWSNNSFVELKWRTATEVDNHGFEVERKSNSIWSKIGFIQGNGNSNSYKDYVFRDSNIKGMGRLFYRLKQIDNNGDFEYSNTIEVNASSLPNEYTIEQNFPNPFNPSTVIRYSLPFESKVSITVFNSLGEVISKIVDGVFEAGYHQVRFNASDLSSGVYFYTLDAVAMEGGKNYRLTNKMLLIK